MHTMSEKWQKLVGCVVRMNAKIVDTEANPDEGMMAVVEKIVEHHDDVVEVVCNFEKFVEYNKLLAKANFYPKNHGDGLVTWFESCYPSNHKERLFQMVEDIEKNNLCFDVVDASQQTVVVLLTKSEAEVILGLSPPTLEGFLSGKLDVKNAAFAKIRKALEAA